MDIRWTFPFLGILFSIFSESKSYPCAFLGLSSTCIMFIIFFGVKNLFDCDTGGGS
jgi:hypothetical protein